METAETEALGSGRSECAAADRGQRARTDMRLKQNKLITVAPNAAQRIGLIEKFQV